MTRRVVALFGLMLCLCLTATAQNKELSIKLDGKDRVYRENLGFAYLTFEYLYPNDNNARVRVVIENITSDPPHAVLIFRKERTEQSLKKGSPKIEFEKKYPGKKGTRVVRGCRECNNFVEIIPAAVTDTVFTIDVPFSSSKDFTLPLYEAKYKAKDLKKGADKINYKIMSGHLYDVHIEVEGWSENDSTYVATKKAVDSFISSLDGVKFCKNKRHYPAYKKQQRPYQEKKDSLIKVIDTILKNHRQWLSCDTPRVAYTRLLSELNAINFNSMTYDCGRHKSGGHSCSLCSLSAQEICQRLDDLYQQLYVGKTDKELALKQAKSLYNCYQQSGKRKKDSSYGSKISKFYNRISSY